MRSGRNCAFLALKVLHLDHVRLGVLVGDDLDRSGEELVAAGVIAVRVGIDDHRDRLVCHRSDLVHDRPAPVGELGVDEDDVLAKSRRPPYCRRRLDHEQVVADLFDFGDIRLLFRRLHRGNGHRARRH